MGVCGKDQGKQQRGGVGGRNDRSDDWPRGVGRKDGRLQIEASAGIQGARNLLVQHGDRAVLGWFIAPVTHDMDSPGDGEWAISEPGVADATRTQDYLSQAGTAWSQLRLDQPLANRVEHGLRAIVDLQLFVHVAHVVANGFLADVSRRAICLFAWPAASSLRILTSRAVRPS